MSHSCSSYLVLEADLRSPDGTRWEFSATVALKVGDSSRIKNQLD